MDLKKTVDFLRGNHVDEESINITLALVEAGATDTVFFHGLTDEEVLKELIEIHYTNKNAFFMMCLKSDVDCTAEAYMEFLLKEDQLCFALEELLGIYKGITTKGADRYGFTKFTGLDRVDQKEPRC